MKLTAKAIKKISEGDTRAFLCTALNCSYHTVNRWLRDNEADNKLTTVTALQIIKEKTGLDQSEILEKGLDQPEILK